MCGIIAEFNKNKIKANDFIVNQYEEQYSRGQRGFGIIRIDKKANIEIDRACEPTKFILDLYMKPSTMIIAHHRTPTSTENWLNQTHPIVISNKILKNDYYVVHNGIISNDRELHNKHEELGFIYQTEYEEEIYTTKRIKYNDSEAIGIELALFIENKITAIGTDNNAAFIVLQVDKKTNKAKKIFFGRNGNGSDLNISRKKKSLRISSEGEGKAVEENLLFSFNINDPKMILSKKKIEFKGKPKEITHSGYCECLTCKAGRAVNEVTKTSGTITNQSLLPISKEKDGLAEDETPQIRAWATDGDMILLDYDPEAMIYRDKNYKDIISQEFKERIKGEDSMTISHIIDDALDEEVEKVSELLTYFKDSLLINKTHPKEKGFYLSQIAAILKTMEAITDSAEEEYKEKILLEEDEINDYNAGFNLDKRTYCGNPEQEQERRDRYETERMYGMGF